MKSFIGLLLIAVYLNGCVYTFSMTDRTQKVGEVVEVSNSFYLWGLAGKGKISLYKLCNHGVYKVKDEQSIGYLLITYLTIGLFQPRTVEVTCAK